MDCTPKRRSGLIVQRATAVCAFALLFGGLLAVGCAPSASLDLADARFSFLAVGDTGLAPDSHDGQARVAEQMLAEDRAAPVGALVLLGDNFYPSGLSTADLPARIAYNLVTPYCAFVRAGRRFAEVNSGCPVAAATNREIWAVLGNHDYDLPESPGLQREAVPEFVSNWHMNRDIVEVHEVAPGLQLLLVDSMRLLEAGPEPLRRAIDRAPGPWRIIVSHHPLLAGWGANDGLADEVAAIQQAFEDAPHPVQLVLSGHEHNLQAFVPGDNGPGLHVIVGGGSSARKVEPGPPSRVVARETRGFARVSILSGPPERLHVELIASPKPRFWQAGYRERLAQFTLDPSGKRVSP